MSAPTPMTAASVPDSGTCIMLILWTVKHTISGCLCVQPPLLLILC